MKKYLPHALAALFFISSAALFAFVLDIRRELSETRTALAAQTAYISGQKADIQKANTKLGLAESAIVSKDTIIKKYESDIEALNLEVSDLRAKVNAQPKSRDSGTIIIYQEVPGGTQDTGSKDGATTYSWIDPTGRFHLIDPDIAKSGNENFSYKLKIRVTGYVLADPTGTIQARQVIAQEIIERTNSDGSVSEELGSPLPIENNIYEYSPQKIERKISDIIRPRAYALFDTSLNPGFGVELFNFGNYFDYFNIGAGPFISIETSGFPANLQGSLLGIGAQYTLVPPLVSTNIGIGIGVSTPADDFLGRFVVTGNIIFYLTN